MFATGSRRDMVDKRTCGCWVRGRCQRTTLKFCFQGTVVKSANQIACVRCARFASSFLAWTDHKTERTTPTNVPGGSTRRSAKTATLCLAFIALAVPSSPIASPAVLQPTLVDTADSAASTAAMEPQANLPETILKCDDTNCSDIQIVSDLHLEFLAGRRKDGDLDELITPTAPILALLGDIGSPLQPIYRDFLLMQAQRFKAVLVLSGNHEYYSLHQHSTPQPQEGGSWRLAKAASKLRHASVEDITAAISRICEEHPALHYVVR